MTQTLTTQGEIPDRINGRVPDADSPAVPMRARARLPVTERDGKEDREPVRTGWWGLTASPRPLAELWALSGVDRKRVPNNAPALRALWHVSNWTDRLILFALILVLPTVCTGPLRWCAQRPTRRAGLYLTLAGLTAAYLIGRK